MQKSTIATAWLLLVGTAAQAQEAPVDMSNSVFDDTHLSIGVGVGYGPSYQGSDDEVVSPLPIFSGSIEGFAIQPRRAGAAIDLIRDSRKGKAVEFIAGPVGTLNFDRTRQIKDPVVKSLGKLDEAVELGATAGVAFNKVLNPYDSLTGTVDVKWDVAGAHDGMIVSPSLTYFTPVSRGAAISLSVSAEHVDNDYADTYFSITPAGNTASGLPVFDADSGWKNVGAMLFGFLDLDGDLTNGGFSLIGLAGYSRMLEDSKRSPVTSIRGDADQWLFAGGIGYTF